MNKSFLKSVFQFIGNFLGLILALIFPKLLIKVIQHFGFYIYSGWIKFSLKKCGNSFSIQPSFDYVGLENITIGNNFSSFSRLRMEAYTRHNNNYYTPEIIIGDNVSINYDCHIGCVNKIVIGDNVLLASRVFITDHYHGEVSAQSIMIPPSERIVISKGPVVIENNVWIGEGAAIMPNLTIGANSIVGANAVVTKSFPPNSVIAGVPAKLIKSL
ncbi:acyltransferase [Mucilaginibacter galii]|uniref:Acyltransferase n=1 Tax=Mucilaginibacter galii TaxID=2005073 RepID=A0A917J982_9SPHI|nr:acyltransferase [Mucilaginibacter galii]GGI51460.1 hypothetical protein GCM10011425_26720 [Mucilaginibacter galii]